MEQAIQDTRRGSTSDRLRPAPSYAHPVTFHYEIQNHTTRMQRITKAFKVYRLMILTLVCVVAGILIGLWCRKYAKNWSERQFMYIEMPGELYLRFLKLMIIPLLVSNVILSFGTIQGKITSHLGKVAGSIYIINNVLAITVAIVTALLMCPGRSGISFNAPPGDTTNYLNTPQIPVAHDGHNLANVQLLNQYHDSITRYREFHPMSYHTINEDNQNPEPHVGSHHQMISITNHNEPNQLIDLNPQIETRSQEDKVNNDTKQNQTTTTDQQHDDDLLYVVRYINERDAKNHHGLLKEINRISLGTKLPIDVVLDVLRNLVPDSLIGAAMQQTRTRLFAPKELVVNKNGTTSPTADRWPMGHEIIHQANIIGLLAVSVLTGVVLSHMDKASKPLLDLCSCISELSLRVGMKAIHLAPFCIMFLLIGQVARARDLSSMASELLMYCITVITALCLHGFVLLPLVYYFITKKSPLVFFKGMLEALVASFATSSSSATMALMLNCLAELDLNIVIVRAFGPLGCVFNMNGTAIYEAVGAIFIAQTLGVTLTLTSIMLIGFCSAIASLSTSGIPSSGLMTMVIVLNAINLPVLQLTLLYIVDFIIDRFRTVINVWSGAVVCGLIDHICPEHLFEEEMKPDKYREMMKYRASRGSLSSRKSVSVEEKPQVISVTITPPLESSSV